MTRESSPMLTDAALGAVYTTYADAVHGDAHSMRHLRTAVVAFLAAQDRDALARVVEHQLLARTTLTMNEVVGIARAVVDALLGPEGEL